MKNIKKIALYATIIVATIYHSQVYSAPGYPDLAVNGLTEVANGIKDAAQHIDPTLLDQAAGILGDKLKEAAPTIGSDAFGYGSTVIGAGIAIYGTIQLATDVYGRYNPDEEKKARINAARESNEYFEAKRGLRSCLMNNPWTPRNNTGIPTICEKFSRTYYMVAGQAALDEMTKNFKNAYQE